MVDSIPADPCLEFLRKIYERVPEARDLVPIEDLLDLARAALTQKAAA